MKKVTTRAQSCLETLYWGAAEGVVRRKTKTQGEKKGWLKIERRNETIKHELRGEMPHDQKGTRWGLWKPDFFNQL